MVKETGEIRRLDEEARQTLINFLTQQLQEAMHSLQQQQALFVEVQHRIVKFKQRVEFFEEQLLNLSHSLPEVSWERGILDESSDCLDLESSDLNWQGVELPIASSSHGGNPPSKLDKRAEIAVLGSFQDEQVFKIESPEVEIVEVTGETNLESSEQPILNVSDLEGVASVAQEQDEGNVGRRPIQMR